MAGAALCTAAVASARSSMSLSMGQSGREGGRGHLGAFAREEGVGEEALGQQGLSRRGGLGRRGLMLGWRSPSRPRAALQDLTMNVLQILESCQ